MTTPDGRAQQVIAYVGRSSYLARLSGLRFETGLVGRGIALARFGGPSWGNAAAAVLVVVRDEAIVLAVHER